jgi:hypothetical protein
MNEIRIGRYRKKDSTYDNVVKYMDNDIVVATKEGREKLC